VHELEAKVGNFLQVLRELNWKKNIRTKLINKQIKKVYIIARWVE
jgi:hypothetical protein